MPPWIISSPLRTKPLSVSPGNKRQTQAEEWRESQGCWGLQPRALNFSRKFIEWKTFTRTACAAS